MTLEIESMFVGALYRIHRNANGRAADAKTEIRAMVESARRSIGQRFRWIGGR